MNESVAELQPREGFLLYRGWADVVIPPEPAIPSEEGLHIIITHPQDRTDLPVDVLNRFVLGLGVAKVVAESGITPDAWANTRIEEGQRVSVYGRVAENPDSWRRPIEAHTSAKGIGNSADAHYDIKSLRILLARYLAYWEAFGDRVSLFEHGVGGQDKQTILQGEKDVLVWENNKYTVNAIYKRHLFGNHLVVSPKSSYFGDFARQWQTAHQGGQQFITGTLEATAIALGIQKLMGGNGEIHNSGNWAVGLKTTNQGGTLSLEGLKAGRKAEKRRHRPDIAAPEAAFGTHMHAHVYMPFDDGPVVLPQMSEYDAHETLKNPQKSGIRANIPNEALKRWESAGVLTQKDLDSVVGAIGGGKLETWLLHYAATGPLMQHPLI